MRKNKTNLLDKTEKLVIKAGLKGIISDNELVAIKTHFGERGNTAFAPSFYFRRIVDLIKEAGGKPFVKVKIASAVFSADSVIAVSHFKGHEMTGFGGALKNVGMGLGSSKYELKKLSL